MRVLEVDRAMKRAANVWDRFYRDHEAPWRGERAVEPLRPFLGSGLVLELGCGNGKLLKPLLKEGIDAVGLDLSWNALSRLAATAPRVLADAVKLPFSSGAFWTVLDIHCTGHLGAAGRVAAMSEVFRVLRSGGHFVVERLGAADLRGSQGLPVEGEAGMRKVADGRRTHFTTVEALRDEVAAAGFVPLTHAVEQRMPGHRGRQVVRESVRWVFRRP